MPYFAEKLHLRRVEGIVFWKFELCREDAAFERRALGTLYQRFPGEEVVFIDRPGGDAVGWGGEEGFVFREEPFGGHA